MTNLFKTVRKFVAPGGNRFVLNPTKYVNPTAFKGFDLEGWSKTQYQYRSDARWTDSLQDPMVTVEKGKGDCEDYAAVALATLMARGKEEIIVTSHIGIPQGHVTVWCDGKLYSSGQIREMPLEKYNKQNKYFWQFSTTVRP